MNYAAAAMEMKQIFLRGTKTSYGILRMFK
jgi:hypothetical protein